MIMSTFAESFDFTGKTIIPVHDARDERAGDDGARLRRIVPRRDHRRGPRGARRGGERRRRSGRVVAQAHRTAQGDALDAC